METFGKQFPAPLLPATLVPKWNKFLATRSIARKFEIVGPSDIFIWPNQWHLFQAIHILRSFIILINCIGKPVHSLQEKKKTTQLDVLMSYFFLYCYGCTWHHSWNISEANFQTSRRSQVLFLSSVAFASFQNLAALGLLTVFSRTRSSQPL